MKTTNTTFTLVTRGFFVTLLFLAISQPARSSIISNGGFETGDLTDWSASGNIIVFGDFVNPCCVPSEGQFAVGFNGGDTTPNGKLSQTFSTVVDGEYNLNFDFAKGGIGGGIASLSIEITGLNTLLNEVVSDNTGGLPGQYSNFSYSFIANSTDSTLIFTDISNGTVNFDVLLDNVSVSNVPIPAAIWLFGSGLLTLLGVRRSLS